jgi:hypothetical protein
MDLNGLPAKLEQFVQQEIAGKASIHRRVGWARPLTTRSLRVTMSWLVNLPWTGQKCALNFLSATCVSIFLSVRD